MQFTASVFLTVFSITTLASGTTTEECIEAHVASQQMRSRSQLLEAKKNVVKCGASECPGVLRGECGEWLSELDKEIPSFIVVVTSSDGTEVGAVSLILDDGTQEIHAGMTNEANPGAHVVEAKAVGFQTKRLEFTANVGEQDRRVKISLEPLVPPESLEPLKRPAPSWPYFAFGGGVALGTAGFAVLGSMARSEENDLANRCEPNCTDSEIAAVRSKYLAANIGLGVAVASLAGAGLYYYFTRSTVSVRPMAGGSSIHFFAQF